MTSWPGGALFGPSEADERTGRFPRGGLPGALRRLHPGKGDGGWISAAVYAHDVAWGAAVMAAALVVRYRFERKPLPDHLLSRSTIVFALVCALVFPLMRLHRAMWRHTAIGDLVRLAAAVAIAVAATLPILFAIDRLRDFPRSTPAAVAVALFAALALGRTLAQAGARGDLRAAFRLEDRTLAPAIVVGGLDAAAAFLAAQDRSVAGRVRVMGIVTSQAAPTGRTVRGVEVMGGLARLAGALAGVAAAEERPALVVLAEPRPERALMEAVVAAAARAGARVARVRGGAEAGLAPMEAADLLDRPPRALDAGHARALIAGRRVLVTGAGGTIGAELTRQILQLGPAALTLVDASEFNLYAIDHALAAGTGPRVWRAELGDVRDAARMAALFARDRPQVVLHAAALKHVPLMELNPTEAVRTNVGGAVVIAELARRWSEVLVFVSTDKAVNPTNVMGATKRVAEQAVRAIAAGSGLRAAVVRFGNVLGSAGSVVPLFERQIAEGGPVTVTHPDMVRYFMTVVEAASLVLQAAALPASGADAGVYVLDMGDPVRIDHLARQLIRLHGLRPDLDIAIVHTGLRAGEKLFEEVFYDAESVTPTAADGVLAATDATPAWAALEPPVRALVAAAENQDVDATLGRLRRLVPQFGPSPPASSPAPPPRSLRDSSPRGGADGSRWSPAPLEEGAGRPAG